MNLIHTPAEFGECVSAKSLYPYIEVPMLTYEAWIASLPHWPCNRNSHRSGCRIAESGGELYLNLNYAAYCLLATHGDFIAAMGYLLMEETLQGKHGEGADRLSRVLEAHIPLVLPGGRVRAKDLHSFLEIETDFGRWIACLKKQYGMKPGKDYMRVRTKHAGSQMVLLPGFVTKVMNGTQTTRGLCIRDFIAEAELERRMCREVC